MNHGSENSLCQEGRCALNDCWGRKKPHRRVSCAIDQSGWDRLRRATRTQRSRNQAGIRADPALEQPVTQPLSPTRKPTLDRADRPAQMPGRLLVACALEIAEDHGCRGSVPEAGRSRSGEAAPARPQGSAAGTSSGLAARTLVPPPPGDRGPGTRSGPVSDLMQPRAQRIPHPERASLAHQDQERRLEGILRRRAGRPARRGRRAAPSARAARPVPRRPARRPRPDRSRTAPGADRPSAPEACRRYRACENA